MATPPAAIGITGSLIPRVPRTCRSSVNASATIAPGRLRPALFGLPSLTRPAFPCAEGSVRAVTADGRGRPVGCSSTCKLYLEKLGFLMPKQFVDLRHVTVRELVELALGPAAIVLAGV